MGESYTAFAKVYDTLMRDVDYDEWAAYLHGFLLRGGLDTAAVADCACGTGQLSIRLAQLGHRVTGIDRSESMLHEAAENARLRGLTVPFVQQDMKKLRLHKQTDAVTCACDGVNYLLSASEVRAFFKAAHAALRPGGMLLFDVSSRYKLEHVLGCNTFGEAERACAYLWKNGYDSASRLCEMQLTLFVENGGLYERFDERHVQRAHSVRELTGWLKEAGFTDVRAYEAFTLAAPKDTAERIQFAAVKTAE
ncbi:MAG TPA: class I SAM-dependent methyltransferase [Feifaniaceae bacterium]|nr:class I SAM-dependent methyltransferase [Feifaniaceae bacterium]